MTHCIFKIKVIPVANMTIDLFVYCVLCTVCLWFSFSYIHLIVHTFNYVIIMECSEQSFSGPVNANVSVCPGRYI